MKHFGWAETKLIPEVLFFQEGPGVRKWQFRESGVKLLNGRNINDNALDLSTTSVYLSEDEANGKYSHFLAEEGDFVIACSGITIEKFDKKSAFVKKEHLPLCMNTSTMRFKSLNENVLDIRFFNYYIRSNAFLSQLQRLITGSAQLNFGPSHVKKIAIPLPPLEEQKLIAGILDEADRVRKKTQALIDKYDELAQSLFLDMFGDPVTNPKGWKLRTVDECCLVTDYVANGSFASLKANVRYNYDKDFAVLVRTTDNTKGWNGNYVYVPESSFHFLSKSELSKGDLIIANVGDPGKCFLCPDLGQPMTLGPNSILVRSLVEKLNQPYLYHLFASSSGQRMIDRICSATAQKKFNKTSFRALEIPVPDAKTLDKFGQVIETHERQIGYEKNQLNKTEALFNALLQKAFKGELT